MSKVEIQEDGQIPIFTAVYLVNPVLDRENSKALFEISPFHVTYHYEPGNPYFPEDVCDGDWTQIIHEGIYDDGEVLASKVKVLYPEILDEGSQGYMNYQCDRKVEDNGETKYIPGYPLHITWDSGKLPPAVVGERLEELGRKSREERDKCFTQTNYKQSYSQNKNPFMKESILEANGLDSDNTEDRKVYIDRIKPIFSFFNPIGIWKVFKADPKDEG